MSLTRRAAAVELTELLRMSTGDKLSLRAWYDAAQSLVRRARESGLELPPFVHEWLAGAEARAKDPLLAATQNAELAKLLHELSRE
jgi:hypothetical protein